LKSSEAFAENKLLLLLILLVNRKLKTLFPALNDASIHGCKQTKIRQVPLSSGLLLLVLYINYDSLALKQTLFIVLFLFVS